MKHRIPAGTHALDAEALARERADFIALYKEKGWATQDFAAHPERHGEFANARTQQHWIGWCDRASLDDRPASVFVPHAECVQADGACLNEARCVVDCRTRTWRPFYGPGS